MKEQLYDIYALAQAAGAADLAVGVALDRGGHPDLAQ